MTFEVNEISLRSFKISYQNDHRFKVGKDLVVSYLLIQTELVSLSCGEVVFKALENSSNTDD